MEEQILEDLDQLSLSCYEEQTCTGFSPLQDVPVDSYAHTDTHTTSNTPAAVIPNWLLTEDTHSDSPQIPENALTQPDTERGRLLLQKEHSGIRRDGEEGPGHDVLLTVVDMPRHKRPLLSQVFSSLKKSHSSSVSPVDQFEQQQRSYTHDDHTEQEFDFTTVNISKTKQSLGMSVICISSQCICFLCVIWVKMCVPLIRDQYIRRSGVQGSAHGEDREDFPRRSGVC